jgi:hypothetical protein
LLDGYDQRFALYRSIGLINSAGEVLSANAPAQIQNIYQEKFGLNVLRGQAN